MNALGKHSDRQGVEDVLNEIIYQNTLEMMHVQGGTAHKTSAEVAKMQSAF